MRIGSRLPLALAILGGAHLACTPLEPLPIEEGCQPLVADCMLPYPSDFFRVPDASLPSGHRIELPAPAKPRTDEGFSGDVLDWRAIDGFSRFNPIVAALGDVDPAILVGVLDDPADSVDASSRSLILDAETGQLVPHYADVDPRATDRARAATTLRAFVGLAEQRRYIVAFRASTDVAGKPIAPPEGFRRLRDRQTVQDPALAALQARFDDEIFAPLEEAGVARDELLLAWDFTTGSDAHVYTDMLQARAAALTWLSENEPVVEIEGVAEEDTEGLWRTVFGRVTGPRYIDEDAAGAMLSRDESGNIAQSGELSFPFTATVPISIRDGANPGRAVLYGHGFFGQQDEVESGGATETANHANAVMFAIDWQGMSIQDIGITVSTIGGDVANSPVFTERVPQAMVNWLVMTAAIEGQLKTEDAFRRPTGELVYDDTQLSFMGISQGHILGGVLSALHPRLTRSVLQVGGAGLSHMMFRALPFERFLFLLDFSMPDPLDQQKYSAMVQRHFDRIDPAFWADYVLDQELPIGPSSNPEDREVLVQMGVGDTQVPNSGSILHARLLNLPLVTPAPMTVFDLETVNDGHLGSAFTIFDFGVDPSFTTSPEPPVRASYTHDGMRHHVEVQEQIKVFWDSGVIVQPCDGACLLLPL